MTRKAAEPSSRRSPRRRPPPDVPAPARPARKSAQEPVDSLDSDFGLALALCPALRRRPDA